jgi:hypothetical protein
MDSKNTKMTPISGEITSQNSKLLDYRRRHIAGSKVGRLINWDITWATGLMHGGLRRSRLRE